MRLVLDTNVLVSGLLNPLGAPGRIVDLLLAEAFVLLVDDRILGEYRDVLNRPHFGFLAADVGALLDVLANASEAVHARPLPPLADPGDQPFLEVAAAGLADSLVTGNSRHYPTRHRPDGLRVETPAEFLRREFA